MNLQHVGKNAFSKSNMNFQKIRLNESSRIVNRKEDKLVMLINRLCAAIKEYYKASTQNNSESFNLLKQFNNFKNQLGMLLNSTTDSENVYIINELTSKIQSIDILIKNYQDTLISNKGNLNSFFEDAKYIFQQLKIAKANNENENLEKGFISEGGKEKKNLSARNMAKLAHKLKGNNEANSKQIIFNRIIKLLNKFDEFIFLLKGSPESYQNYINLQNKIKKELTSLFSDFNKNVDTSIGMNGEEQSNKIINKQNSDNKEIEKLLSIKQTYEKTIRNLRYQLSLFQQKPGEHYLTSDNSDSKGLQQNEKFLKQKNLILKLQQEINIYRKNEFKLNEQIKDLNKQVQLRINQYENKIINLKNMNQKLVMRINQLSQGKRTEKEIKNINDNYFQSDNNLISDNNISRGSNNYSDMKKINNKLMEEKNSLKTQNVELTKKNNQFLLEIKKLNESVNTQKEEIARLTEDIKKKQEELDGLVDYTHKLQGKLEEQSFKNEKKNKSENTAKSFDIPQKQNTDTNVNSSKKNEKDKNLEFVNNVLNQLNDAQKKIDLLQKKNKELLFKLEEKQFEKDYPIFKTQDENISNYEEEFDLKKMANGAREKNRSEDLNIDYPGVQGIKDKYKELNQKMNMLMEQVKFLILNIKISSQIRPQIQQICQLLGINSKNTQLILAGKDKKKALGLL